MGAWISLNQFGYFKKQIKGFVGIGSAPEFLNGLMWKQFSKKIALYLAQEDNSQPGGEGGEEGEEEEGPQESEPRPSQVPRPTLGSRSGERTP